MSTNETDSLFKQPSCVDCGRFGCARGTKDYPDFCITVLEKEKLDDCLNETMADPTVMKIMKAASDASRRGSDEVLCRVEEIMDFARRMGYSRIGIASCYGLAKEARLVAKIFRIHDFDVYGISCKVGSVAKSDLGIDSNSCDHGAITCNPVAQAKLLNDAQTDFNVVIGLCVGHDTLFYMHSEAPCTTLVVKDRVSGHNPMGILNVVEGTSMYNRMLKPDESFSPQK